MDSRIKKIAIASICISICMLLTFSLVFLSEFIPGGAIVFPLIATALTAYIYLRCGKIATALNAVLPMGLMFLLTKDFAIFMTVALCILPGIVSGIMINRKANYYTTLFGSSAAFLAVLIGMLLWAGQGIEGGVGGMIDIYVQSIRESLLVTAPAEAAAEIESILNITAEYIKFVFPASMILVSLAAGYLHMVILRLIAGKISRIRYDYVPFDSHMVPRKTAYLYFIVSIIVIFLSETSKMGVALNNIVIIIDCVLAFCGLSFIESKFKNKVKIGFLRALIYIAVFIVSSSLAVQILSLVGMFDSFMNYRRIERNGE